MPAPPQAAIALANTPLASRILAALPQTQCTRCGYPDCAAYADAIATGTADINQCPPGGAEGIERLAAITGLPANALNPANGTEGPRSVAVIDEEWCIGCTLCLPACPTDAILGSNKMMHTIIEQYCTGCELCISVCPVDCISLENVTGERAGWAAWPQSEADMARDRYEFHSLSRLITGPDSPEIHLNTVEKETTAADKRAVIEAALARARATRQALTQPPSPKKR